MAKQRHDEPQPASSRNALIFLSLGGIAVAALVVWALTRTVDTTTLQTTATTPTTTEGAFTPAQPTPTQPAPITTEFTPTTTTAPTATTATAEMVGDRSSVERIAAEDLREQLRTNGVTVVDVRDAQSYAAGHIPGALHIPLASVETMMSTLPKDKPIVTYCT